MPLFLERIERLRSAGARASPDPDLAAFFYIFHLLGLGELRSLVRKAFERGFIEPMILGYQDFLDDLRRCRKTPGAPRRPGDDDLTLIGDPTEELAAYFEVRPALHDTMELPESGPAWADHPAPAVNPYKGVGRNDPCPCGSGKKLKRCCLA